MQDSLHNPLQGNAHQVFDWLSEGLGLEVELEVTCIVFLLDRGFSSYHELLF